MKVRSFLSAVGRLSLVLLLFFIQTNGAYSQALNDVGAPGFSVSLTGYNALAFNGTTPFMAYQHDFYSSRSTVMKFDGTNWATAGSAGISTGSTTYINPTQPIIQ